MGDKCKGPYTLFSLVGNVLCQPGAPLWPQSFKYEGDCKDFNFDKYLNLHIEQHNQHADLQEYGVAPLAKNLKTLWF